MSNIDEIIREAKVAALTEALAEIDRYNAAELPSYADVQTGVEGAKEAIQKLINLLLPQVQVGEI